MSVLRVRLIGDPVLRTRCELVTDVDQHQRLIDDMLETVRSSGRAVALAAPQVGVPLRLWVFAERPDEPKVFVNPVIECAGFERIEVSEGCLSIPDFFPFIERSRRVEGHALNRWGEPFEFDEDNTLLGHAVQHEGDHLSGKLMFDRMKREDREALLRKIPPELHRLRKGIREAMRTSR